MVMFLQGERYHVRVSAFNMRGFGPAQMATPASAVPSSWHDVGGSHPRFEGSTDNIHIISAQLSMTLSNSPPLSPSELQLLKYLGPCLVNPFFGGGLREFFFILVTPLKSQAVYNIVNLWRG